MMDNYLYTINQKLVGNQHKQAALSALESGHIIYLPENTLPLTEQEQPLLSTTLLPANRKNISYDYLKDKLSGPRKSDPRANALHAMMKRYALYARQLVDTMFSEYTAAIQWGRTSYRPAEIKGRVSSKRQDDTRVHVDAFPSTPVHGLRILRVFCNIHPQDEPRVWEVGEPLSTVIQRFAHQIPRYHSTKARLLHLFRATKSKRGAYDHCMLHLHDQMKLDDLYQQTVKKQRIDFPPKSTWLVFTDQVSHAALSGQFLLEQTFYLPVSAMLNSNLSPLKHWESVGLVN